MLADVDETLNEPGMSLVFAEMKDPVLPEDRARNELTRTIDPDHFFRTLDAAIEALRQDVRLQWEVPRESRNEES